YRGTEFHPAEGPGNGDRLTFYKKAAVSRTFNADPPGDYQLALELAVDGEFQVDPGKCTVAVKLDDRELARETYGWADNKTFRSSFNASLPGSDHRLSFELEPITPPEKKRNSLDLRIVSVKVRGPMDPRHWTRSRNYDRFFFKEEPP